VREELQVKLYGIADSIGWANLSAVAKAKHYEHWTRDSEIGGVLARYMDKGKVRVYLKDTLLKDYTRKTLSDDSRPLRVLGITQPPVIGERFIKPHGLRLADGRVVAWGRADDWKLILMAIYERTRAHPGSSAFGAVLLNSTGRFDEPSTCSMIEEAAKRLGIQQVVWLRA
jgi:hypothetical protein